MNLPADMRKGVDEIEGHAREAGLEPFPTVFELVDVDEMNEVAALGGFPTRYPHWRFGMEYEGLRKGHVYGLQRIFELVINNNPCYAYLLKSNTPVIQKIVIAHVFGHSDFFKNNMWFVKTNRRMMDEMANHGTRVRKAIERYGLERVENFLDVCHTLENLVDPTLPFAALPGGPARGASAETEPAPIAVRRLKSKDYMDRFVNPPDLLAARRQKAEEEREKQRKRFPREPRKDVLQFLVENAPLERWERDLLTMTREEMYYFVPQMQTKTLNEGWAAFWHSTLMTSRILRDAEVVDYADCHSATLGGGSGALNPYKLGIELFRDIEERWNKGRFGPEWDSCDDLDRRSRWDLHLGLGREKIFEVRRIYNDIGFIDEFITEEFCHRHKLFTYRWNAQTNRYEIADRDWRKVKQQLLFGLTNLGSPHITVVDGNYGNRGEMYLVHRHEGVDLRLDHARDTLRGLFRIWQRPVHIETLVEGKGKLLSYDGQENTEKDVKVA
ncbi:MAG: SpoVR family protein [Planctomycetales bacterium]|nr:SpoVR family protein [Planctomycetales bacterium]